MSQPLMTPREREILSHLTRGQASKVVALELGIAESTVATYVRRLCTKLRCDGRLHLIGRMGTERPRASCRDERALTTAEREVVAFLLVPCSNLEIARRRGTSARTVANQLASIYRKLAVGSRAELIARFAPEHHSAAGAIGSETLLSA